MNKAAIPARAAAATATPVPVPAASNLAAAPVNASTLEVAAPGLIDVPLNDPAPTPAPAPLTVGSATAVVMAAGTSPTLVIAWGTTPPAETGVAGRPVLVMNDT